MPLWQPHIVSCVKLDAMSLIDLAKEALSLSLSLSLSLISHLSSDLCTGLRLMNALNINSVSLTYEVLTTSQPDYYTYA